MTGGRYALLQNEHSVLRVERPSLRTEEFRGLR